MGELGLEPVLQGPRPSGPMSCPLHTLPPVSRVLMRTKGQESAKLLGCGSQVGVATEPHTESPEEVPPGCSRAAHPAASRALCP